MKKDNYFFSFIIFIVIVCNISIPAQLESPIPQVFNAIYHDTSPPLSDIPELPITQSKWRDGIIPLNKIGLQFEDRYGNDPDLQTLMGVDGISEIITSWNGISADGYAPPDPSGDVGLNHYMLATNVRFQIWNKTGTSLLGPLNLGTIWSGFPGPWASSLNDGDPIVLYDETADRWFIAQFSLPNYPSSPSYILIAISQTGNPTGAWHRYGFSFSTGIPDYPKFGIWPDGYYMSANSFNPGYVGTIVAAFQRSQMLNGLSAQMVTFSNSSSSTWSLLPSDWNGTTTPPASAPNYFGQIHDNSRYGGSDGFDIYSFSVNWTTPSNSTFTGPTFLATNAFSTVNGIPQLGTSQLLDDLSVMTMNRLDYRNFGTHQSMVVCHTVNAGSGRAGVRWYEFRRTSGNWSIYQQGTYAPSDGLHRWMGSIAINSAGDIALGYSVSGSSIYPGIRYTGRLSGDALGQMTFTEGTIQDGLGAQTGGLDRWGDYTQMVVDPNGETFWYVNQYQPSTGSFNWRTRIASLGLGILNPTSVSANAINSSQINISFNPNSSNNNVVVVWNLTGTFTTPSGTPPVVGQSFAGGTLLYNGTISPVQHTGLIPETNYYYKLFSYNGSTYSSGVPINATTLSISNPTNVTATAISSSQIDIGFTPNIFNNNVVLVWNLSGTFTTPSGTPPAVGQPFAGGTLLYNGIVSPFNHIGLNPFTTYYYKAFSYDGANYSSGITVNTTTLVLTDFLVDLIVSDECNNSMIIKFGTAPGATDCFDPGLDIEAPPPPPVDAFDARFTSCGIPFLTDVRGTNLSGERFWSLRYQPATGCEPANLSWNASQLPSTGYFHLVDPGSNNIVNVNMRTTNQFNDLSGFGILRIKFNYQITSNYNISSGWNMISLPVDVSNNNYLALFPSAIAGTLFGYSNGYFSTETVNTCTGYWLKFASSQVVPVSGADRIDCVISLNTGWNIIGGPYCNVPLSSVQDPGGIIVTGTLFEYSGGYISANSIDGTKAYWIKASSSGTITISCNNVVMKENNELEKISEATEEFSQIEITDRANNSQTLYLNGKLEGSINKESYSMPPVPPVGAFDVRLEDDYKLTENDEATIKIQASEYPVRIKITNLKNGVEYRLVEISSGEEAGSHKVVNGEEIIINNESVNKLRIEKAGEIPEAYSLEQNYPNPFNPMTTIKFDLPEASEVTLTIYNTLGQKVDEVVNTTLEAGRYSYQWNATDIASGIYIYELRTNKFISSKKMIFMK
ncbi:MAG: T9SS type A sorting domain-containing protein [bacterium]|nr:T9SS type A sorting domain-containing protein [bacterium]